MTDPSDATARLARQYSAIARDYAELWAPVLLPYTGALLDRLPLDRAEKVLDLGTGVGAALPEIQRRAPSATVIGADVATGMIAEAPTGHHLVAMDAARRCFAGASFDVVVSAFVMFNVPDLDAALEGVRTMLRAGGAFGLTSWADEEESEAARVVADELDAAGAAPGPATVPARERLDSEEEMAAELTGAGFVDVQTAAVPFEDRRDAARAIEVFTRIGSARFRLESLPIEERRRCLERIRRRFERLPEEAFVERDRVILGVGRVLL